MEHLEIKRFKTVTQDKLQIERLKKLLGSQLIDQALSRAALFYTSQSDLPKQKKFLDLKNDIMEELLK